jgi:hypothetical protein
MELIYKSACCGVFWLVLAGDSSALALSTLEYLGKQLELTMRQSRARYPESTERDWHRSRVRLPYNDTTWDALVHFFQRPWFERLWVVQEAQLSNRYSIVQCGHDEVLWSLIC